MILRGMLSDKENLILYKSKEERYGREEARRIHKGFELGTIVKEFQGKAEQIAEIVSENKLAIMGERKETSLKISQETNEKIVELSQKANVSKIAVVRALLWMRSIQLSNLNQGEKKMDEERIITIITQNVNRKVDDENVNKEIDNMNSKLTTSADIYAFQEFSRNNCGIAEFNAISNMKKFEIFSIGNSRMKELWERDFPWINFKSGYWKEMEVEIKGTYIYIINVHMSCTYSLALRYLLLRRLDELEGKNVILLGDFNAAFNSQTEKTIEENHKFLCEIIRKGYIECEPEGGKKYTFEDENGLKKRIDHVFVSLNLKEKIVDEKTEIVDICPSDHKGIKIEFAI